MSRMRWYGPSIVLLLTVVSVMLIGPRLIQTISHAQTEAEIQQIRLDLNNSRFLKQLSDSFRGVSLAVEPSVVHIKVLSRVNRRVPGDPDMLRRWFFGPGGPQDPRDFFERRREQQEELEQYDVPRETGNGSGWVYDDNGHIITNNHVVDGADEIVVRFSDGDEHKATVVGTDPNTDIAVLRVDKKLLHPAELATEPAQQGDIVFAFGSPFRFDFSMSQGIVSGKGRRLGLTGRQGYERFIQTDAAINPGNSGGPLTNINGQVIGMNTAIASRTGSYNGLGFAIPVDMIRDVVSQLITKGKVSRGYLGVFIEDLDENMAATFNFDGEGVLVVNPIPDSPGDKAGIKAGDIITHIEDQQVTSADDLRMRIARHTPGTKIKVTVYRQGESQTLQVTLAELPSDGRLSAAESSGQDQGDGQSDDALVLRKLGFEGLSDFDETTARRMGVDHQPGVLVVNVRQGSVAASKGITRGNLIVSVMNDKVKNVEQLVEALKKYKPGDLVRMRVLRYSAEDRMFASDFEVFKLPE